MPFDVDEDEYCPECGETLDECACDEDSDDEDDLREEDD